MLLMLSSGKAGTSYMCLGTKWGLFYYEKGMSYSIYEHFTFKTASHLEVEYLASQEVTVLKHHS